MRAWRYAERNGYDEERCRRMGIHAQAARQIGLLVRAVLEHRRSRGFGHPREAGGADAVQRCVLLGFSDHLAKRLVAGSLRCELTHGRRGVLARESVVKAPLFVVSEVREVESGAGRDRALNVMLNLATAIKEEWLRELFPADFNESRVRCLRPGVAARGCAGRRPIPRSGFTKRNSPTIHRHGRGGSDSGAGSWRRPLPARELE